MNMGIENRNSKKFQKTGSSNPSVTRKNIANNRGDDSSPRNSNFKVTIGLITITLPTITITQIKTAKE